MVWEGAGIFWVTKCWGFGWCGFEGGKGVKWAENRRFERLDRWMDG